MLDFNPLATSLPQALASALRRLAHLAHTTSWDQWAAQRLTPTQRRILDVVASRSEGKSSVTALAARPDPLQDAFNALTASEQEVFYRSAMKMLRGLQESGALPVSRMCLRCRHFEPFRKPGSEYPHHCHLAGSPLADRHLRLECQEHDAGDEDEQNATWEKFNSPPSEEGAVITLGGQPVES